MRSEVVRVRLRPEERQALAHLCGDDRTASDVIRLLFRTMSNHGAVNCQWLMGNWQLPVILLAMIARTTGNC